MIYVGLHITNPTGYEAQLEQFIRDNCIFEREDIPHEIAYNARNVNVYTNYPLELAPDSWLHNIATPFGYESPQIILASTVNFVLEFPYKGDLLRLYPTEYILAIPEDITRSAIATLIQRGCLRVFGLRDAEGWTLGDFNWDFNTDFGVSFRE